MHVGEKNVTVDVGQHHIEHTTDMRQHMGISVEYINAVVNPIEDSVVAGILDTPLVDVVGHHLFGPHHCCSNAQYARSASTVEYAFAIHVDVEHLAHNHLRGVVSARTESHAGVDANRETSIRVGLHAACGSLRIRSGVRLIVQRMFRIVNHASVVDDDGLEAGLLPCLVPVFILGFLNGVLDVGISQRKIFHTLVEHLWYEQAFLHISVHAIGGFLERLETSVG